MTKPIKPTAVDGPTLDDAANPEVFSNKTFDWIEYTPQAVDYMSDVADFVETKADEVDADATAVETSRQQVVTLEGQALAHKNAAATSEGNAAASAENAATSYDSFDDRYLGPKASDPTLDNDGDALLPGALYWNTASNKLKIHTGSAWADAALEVANVVRTDAHDTLQEGFDSTEEDLGTISSGTVTPEVDGVGTTNFKNLINGGAFALDPPSTSSACCIRIRVTNSASAGAISTSNFDRVIDPDTYATTSGKEYYFYIDHDATRDVLTIREIV